MKYVLLLTLALSPVAEAKFDRAKLNARFTKACETAVSEEEDAPETEREICACIVKELGTESDADFDLLTRALELAPGAEDELQKDKHSDLVIADYEASEDCRKKHGG